MQAKRRALQQSTSRYVKEKAIYDKIKQRRRRGLVRRLVVYAMLAAVLAATFFSIYISQHNLLEEKVEERANLKQELARTKIVENDLREEIKKLHDPEYLGEMARRDFLLSKEGETIFKLPSDSSTN